MSNRDHSSATATIDSQLESIKNQDLFKIMDKQYHSNIIQQNPFQIAPEVKSHHQIRDNRIQQLLQSEINQIEKDLHPNRRIRYNRKNKSTQPNTKHTNKFVVDAKTINHNFQSNMATNMPLQINIENSRNCDGFKSTPDRSRINRTINSAPKIPPLIISNQSMATLRNRTFTTKSTTNATKRNFFDIPYTLDCQGGSPGSYNLPKVFGNHKIDSSCPSSPAFSFPKNRGFSNKQLIFKSGNFGMGRDSPGVGSYNPQSSSSQKSPKNIIFTTAERFPISVRHTHYKQTLPTSYMPLYQTYSRFSGGKIGKQTRFKHNEERVPGPGHYHSEMHQSFEKNSKMGKISVNGSHTFGLTRKPSLTKNRKWVPGPGTYFLKNSDHPLSISFNTLTQTPGKKIRFPKAERYILKKLKKSVGPSPGTYDTVPVTKKADVYTRTGFKFGNSNRDYNFKKVEVNNSVFEKRLKHEAVSFTTDSY